MKYTFIRYRQGKMKNKIFVILDLNGLATLEQLRVGFSALTLHKFRHDFKTISNQKKLKADILISMCLQGTTIPNFASFGERASHNYGNKMQQSNITRSQALPRVRTEAAKKSFWFQCTCFTNCSLIFKVQILLLFSSIDKYYSYYYR